MKQEELQKKLDSIRSNLKLFDSIVNIDFQTHKGQINERQAKLVQELIDLFQSLNWQLAFSQYKELKKDQTQAVKINDTFSGVKTGDPVKIRSCREEHGKKTYFGIFIGNISLSINHSIKDDIVTAGFSQHNPAILIPELNDIVYGCESWWGPIESEEELKELITDDVIQNIWYVKLLKEMHQ